MSEILIEVGISIGTVVFQKVILPGLGGRGKEENLTKLFWFMSDSKCTAMLAWKHPLPLLTKRPVSDDQEALIRLVEALKHKSVSDSLRYKFVHSSLDKLIERAKIEPTGFEDLSGNILLIGGPVSNSFSRDIFEYWRSRGLPFNFKIDDQAGGDRVVRTVYVLKDGIPRPEVIETPNWSLVWQQEEKWREIRPKHDEAKRLQDDYLLISVLPNPKQEGTGNSKHAVAVIAGSSGVGTRAIGVALADNKLLAEIVKEIGGERVKRPYYQCLLRITIRYDSGEPGKPYAIPDKVHLVRAMRIGLKGNGLAIYNRGVHRTKLG